MTDHIGIKNEVKSGVKMSRWMRWTMDNLPYIYFLILLGMIYIGNLQIAERKARKIDRMKEEVQIAQMRYLNEKAELIFSTTFSNIEDEVNALGLIHEPQTPKILHQNPTP